MGIVTALLIDGAIIAVIVIGLTLAKRRFGRRVAARLVEIDVGTLCPACNGTDLDVAIDGRSARCRGCGRVTDLVAARAQTFDAHPVANVRDFPRGGREG